ncbi:Cullin-5 [Dirofilaria immitis]|nr:Cullin-5 [Dirofilaria immitis]
MLRGPANPVDFDKEWTEARSTVISLLNQRGVSKVQWQELFAIVHRICAWIEGGGDMVRRELEAEVHRYILTAEKRIMQHEEENAILRVYISEWTKFYTQTEYLPKPFSYISEQKNVVLKSKNSVKEASVMVSSIMLNDWGQTIFASIKHKLQNAAMRLVELERNGEAFDPQLVIGVRQSYVSLNLNIEDSLIVYKDNFERAYIDDTERFYKSRAPQVLASEGVQSYMVYADTKLGEEEVRGRRYLESTTDSVEKLVERCVKVLVVQFQEQILAECPTLINEGQIEKLRMLYRLINRTSDGIDTVLKFLDTFIRTEALNDMRANSSSITTDPEKYVEQLLTMFSKFSLLVADAFYDDPQWKLRVPKENGLFFFLMCFVGRMQAESRCPELLANFTDLLLRKTSLSKRLSSEEIDAKLNDVLLVLKYVQNKDVFMRFYKAHLTRRLILELSADQEKEEQMITRMREVGMPADFVTKLFRMLQDIEVNKDLNNAFKNSLASNNSCVADSVSIKVLNAGAWSRGSADRMQVQMPRELEDFIPEVEDFYRKQHSGRKLQWHHHWSHGTIVFTNTMGKFDLDVTTLQLSVLYCWNDRPREQLSFECLRTATQLSVPELVRTLYSLVAFPKMRHQVLCTNCSTLNLRDFNDSTLFWINQQFTIVKNGKEQNRGRINLIGRLQLSVETNVQEEHDDIIALRILRIQEAIVKIMKIRKHCQSAQLQTELIELLKHMFLPPKKMIKEQIEWLIENGFIARDSNDFNMHFCNDTRHRLTTLLRTDQKFYDQWVHLIELQHRQFHEQNMGSALKEITDLVLNCAPKLDLKLDHIDYVCPTDIQLYAELGQLTQYCNDNIIELIKGRIDLCQHASYTSSLPSVVKFLTKFIRNLTVIESSNATKLENQTLYLVEKFMKHKNWRNKWKLIIIMPNMEDGELREPEQSAVEVMKSIRLLYEVVPQRTILIVVRTSTLQLWQDASNAHRACQTLLEPWKLYKN